MPSPLYTFAQLKEWLQPATVFLEWLTVMSPFDADLRRQVHRGIHWLQQPAQRALHADEELWAQLTLTNEATCEGTPGTNEVYWRQWSISITAVHIEIDAETVADLAAGPPAPHSFWYSALFTQQSSADGALYAASVYEPLTVFLEDAFNCRKYQTGTEHRWDTDFQFSIRQ